MHKPCKSTFSTAFYLGEEGLGTHMCAQSCRMGRVSAVPPSHSLRHSFWVSHCTWEAAGEQVSQTLLSPTPPPPHTQSTYIIGFGNHAQLFLRVCWHPNSGPHAHWGTAPVLRLSSVALFLCLNFSMVYIAILRMFLENYQCGFLILKQKVILV